MSDLMLDKYSKLPKEMQDQVLEYIEFLVLKYQGKLSEKLEESRPSNFGSAKGLIVMDKDFDQPLEDFKDYR